MIPTPSALSDIGLTEKYWANVSQTAKEFVATCLTVDPMHRPTAAEMLMHRWLADETPHYVPDPGSGGLQATDLLESWARLQGLDGKPN